MLRYGYGSHLNSICTYMICILLSKQEWVRHTIYFYPILQIRKLRLICVILTVKVFMELPEIIKLISLHFSMTFEELVFQQRCLLQVQKWTEPEQQTLAEISSHNWLERWAAPCASPSLRPFRANILTWKDISAKLAASHRCQNNYITWTQPLHPISKLSKILLFLIHWTSEKFFSSLCFERAKKLHLAENSPTCNLLARPVALIMAPRHALCHLCSFGLGSEGPGLGMRCSPVPSGRGLTWFLIFVWCYETFELSNVCSALISFISNVNSSNLLINMLQKCVYINLCLHFLFLLEIFGRERYRTWQSYSKFHLEY